MSGVGRKQPTNNAKGCEGVVAALRGMILDGHWQPGAQLPSRKDLLRSLETAPLTLHHAVHRLVNDGFLRTALGSGTYVVDTPSHLNTYAVVFGFDPAVQGPWNNWSRYYQALTQAAVRLQQETGRRMLMFHGIDNHADSEDRVRLITHIERQRLAGVIFANSPYLLGGTPVLEAPGVPRVAIAGHQQYLQVPVVSTDIAMWVNKALDHLAALGRRRVATLTVGLNLDFQALLKAGLAARGMISHPRWTLFFDGMPPPEGVTQSGLRNVVDLLMHDRERPDALLIADDSYVEEALAGLVAAGVSVLACGEPSRTARGDQVRSDDVALVGHANFPLVPSRILPVRLLGYDANLMLRACVDLIDRQRRGEPVPGETLVPALWEEEVPNAELRNAERGTRNGERGMRNVERGTRNVEHGMRNAMTTLSLEDEGRSVPASSNKVEQS